MGGLAGALAWTGASTPPSWELLEQMLSALAHRGLDAPGGHLEGPLGLAGGDASGDGELWGAFDGSLFNREALRAALSMGAVSDGALLLAAYRAWGEAAFARLDGQWATALWDQRAQRLVLARDRLGARPLFVAQHEGRLLFASEVKALFAAGLPRGFDPLGLDETFTFESAVAPRTVFRGVEALPPGRLWRFHQGERQEATWWHPAYPLRGAGPSLGVEEAGRALEAALLDAVRRRLDLGREEVAIASRGTLEDALLASLAREVTGAEVRTYAFGTGGEPATGLLRPDAAELTEAFRQTAWHAESPLFEKTPALRFLLAQRAKRDGRRRVLSAEGADELFLGHPLFREAKVRRFWARDPKSRWRHRLLERLHPAPLSAGVLQTLGRNLSQPHAVGFSHHRRWSTAAALKQLFSAPLQGALEGWDAIGTLISTFPAEVDAWEPPAQDEYLELRTRLPGVVLSSRSDRVHAAQGVEDVLPLLDNGVVALAQALPAGRKLKVLRPKHVLRWLQSRRAEAPPSREETRASPPLLAALLGEGHPGWVDELLDAPAVLAAQVFEPQAVAKLRARAPQDPALLAVLSTQLVHATLLASAPAPARVALSRLPGQRASEAGKPEIG